MITISKIGKNKSHTYLYLSDGVRINITNNGSKKILDKLETNSDFSIRINSVTKLSDKRAYYSKISYSKGINMGYLDFEFINTKDKDIRKNRRVVLNETKYNELLKKLKEEV